MTAADVRALRAHLGLSQVQFVKRIAAAFPLEKMWTLQTHSDIEIGSITLSQRDAAKIRMAFNPSTSVLPEEGAVR
jgi:hypothetical protein